MYYYHLDQLNTPRFVTNNKAEVVWENQADVYGYEESEISNTNSFTQPIRFQGQYLDEESGLHYNRYRYLMEDGMMKVVNLLLTVGLQVMALRLIMVMF
ncbi:RHS repeat domain-containing protein [Pseudoalteromonas arctica]|uniref:RHS repeat domain-containing protein n=1 Tax=Pseudoalteromonas arctica TaxID=394751 RepID=UPI0032B74981